MADINFDILYPLMVSLSDNLFNKFHELNKKINKKWTDAPTLRNHFTVYNIPVPFFSLQSSTNIRTD